MQEQTYNRKSRLGSKQGQSLILAIVIMFLLSFLGVIFIAMVTRNLFRAGRSSEMLKVEQLARAGIEYADAMLTRSQDGADWSPEPDPGVPANDPDAEWLNAPTDVPAYPTKNHFTRINSGEGRFLLRVSYNPDPADPMSKYIKIESIGRMGTVDAKDPTTLVTAGEHRLKFEMVAYKPIGVTDYARFVTNKEKRTTPISLGFPGYSASFGDIGHGGPIRVNGNLVWSGVNIDIFLRGTAATAVGGASIPLPIDTVAVSGDIKHALSPDKDGTPGEVRLHRLSDNATMTALPSSPAFATFEGFYRDGNDSIDADGYPRAARRIEPPLIDLYDQSSKMMRYRALTRNSGKWDKDKAGQWYNTGYFGWGRGIYVDNYNDVQRESETLFGGYTLRSDWMNPNNPMSPRWRGPFYVPPGVEVTLNPISTDDDNGDGNVDDNDLPDITLTRTDVGSNNVKQVWRNAAGDAQQGWGQTIAIPYPENGVLFAEGNIRIKGMLPPNTQLTVVSGTTIYIEGSILKYRDRTRKFSDAAYVDNRCSIALLAEDYVCVNTTQFVSLLSETSPTAIGSDSQNDSPPFHLIISPEPSSNFRTAFSFGPAGYLDNWSSFHPFICVRHAGQYGSSYINMWVNRRDNVGLNFGLYSFGTFPGLPNTSFVYGLADPLVGGTPDVGIGTVFEHKVWDLNMADPTIPEPCAVLTSAAGYPNYVELGLDQTSIARNNYLLSGFTVEPMDIMIEAIIYAQNKSFFIIPGQWFNPNPDDTLENFAARGQRPAGTDPRFPFFGKPLDIKITIFGAVAENLPAQSGDVSDWAAKWCDIPPYYGSKNDAPTMHPNGGISFMYDEMAGCPVIGAVPIRRDRFGRPLPVTPFLPVSPTLIYSGQAI